MSFSFKIVRRGVARLVLVFCLGIAGRAGLPAHGRPIEFSQPTGPNVNTNVSELGAKSPGLPSLEDSAFKPNSFHSTIGEPNSMKPPTPLPGSPIIRANTRLDRNKNWGIMTSDEMMQSLIVRNVYKQPRSGAEANDLGPAASVESYSLQMFRQNSLTNRLRAYDFRGGSRETNRWDNAYDALNSADPFGAQAGRRILPGGPLSSDSNSGRPFSLSDFFRGGDDLSPDAIRERKALADHLDEFRRLLDPQTPGANVGAMNPATGSSGVGGLGNSSAQRPGGSFSSLPEKINSVFVPPGVPVAPVAPVAPLAPGQTSPTPSPNTEPSKPKSQIVAPLRRNF
jgi:hypothetical protein